MNDDFNRGDCVVFEDEIYGTHTGKVVGILHYADTPTTAVIDVDHELAGVQWSVPIGDLRPLRYRIIMIGPHGERDYLEKLLTDGCPCTCGASEKYAGQWEKPLADQLIRHLKHKWLSPHVDIISEPVLADHSPT